MVRKTSRSEGPIPDPFEPTADHRSSAQGAVHNQVRQVLTMWAAGLAFCDVMVREWTASRRKASEHAMGELIKVDAETDPDKRAQILANVFTEETTSALKDVLAASIRAADVGLTYGMRAMQEAQQKAAEKFGPGAAAPASNHT